MWGDARAQRESGGGFAAEELLHTLALVVPGALLAQGASLEARAMIEASRDLCEDARYRQMLASALARGAARDDDVESAERWGALIEPRSDDLHIDTASRLARAYIATARREWMAVIGVLGQDIDDVPVVDGMDVLAAVLRANAHEQRGDVGRAKAQLMRLMLTPQHVQLVERTIDANRPLILCAQSFAAARQVQAAASGGLTKTSTSFSVGQVLGGGFFLVIAISVILPVTLGLGLATGFIDGVEVMSSLESIGGVGVAVPVMIGIMLALTMIAIIGPIRRMKRGRQSAANLASAGVRGHATVVSIQQTGTRVNKQPVLRFVLQIDAPGHGVYMVEHSEIIPHLLIGRINPGQRVTAHVDQSDPRAVFIDWSGG